MTSLRLIVGRDQFLETGRSALPAILGICGALDIPAHWNESEEALYIAAPIQGRKLALAPGHNRPDVTLPIVAGLQERLTACGAEVTVTDPSADLSDQELLLWIQIASPPVSGVSASYNWAGWQHNRRISAMLTRELSAALGVSDLGGRGVTLAGRQHAGVPVIVIDLPEPDDPQPFATMCADALGRGLTRFWVNPLLEEAFATIAEQIVPPNDKPTPVFPDPPEERVLLGPETITAHRQIPLDDPIRRQKLKAKRVKHPAPPPKPAPEPAPTAAVSAPEPRHSAPEAPAPQVPTPPAPRPKTTVHTFNWQRAILTSAAKANPAQSPKPFQYRAFQSCLPVVSLTGQAQAKKYHPR